jgi:Zn-dependent metalloprotease
MNEDHGGVHTNSGIPNKAFYNVAKQIGGNSWEAAGGIWYVALHR